jgi:flagellar FliL protein
VADKPEASEDVKKPVKSKKLLILIGAVVLVLVLVGGGVFWYISKQRAAAAAEDGGEEAGAKTTAHAADAHAVPPAYLPMDNMVVNLADPGGERVAQVGITLVVADAHASDTVKAFLPTIRSGVLLLLSQHTAADLLTAEGKDKLAKQILREATLPFGGGEEDPPEEEGAAKKKKKAKVEHDFPVKAVLFSSFIVQ